MFIDYDAFQLDGIVRYINCGNDASLNPGEQLTIEAWTRINDTNWNQKVAGKTTPSFNSGYVMAVDQGDVYGEVWNPGLNEIHEGFMPPVMLWYHIAITFEAGGVMRGYVNGEMIQEENVSGNAIGENDAPFIIGIAPWDLANFQTFGEIDEMRLWNVALSEEEIRSNMHRPIDGNQPSVIAYYNFDDGGMTAIDHSSNTNDGTLVGLSADDWAPSRAPIGNDVMMGLTEVVALWNGVGFTDPRFVITDNGLSMSASNIPDLDYCVFGHDEGSGVTTDAIPANAPSGFERADRMWYMNEAGDFEANLSFNLANAAGGGTELDGAQPANHYTLLFHPDNTGNLVPIAAGNDLNGSVVTFDDVALASGYYTIGVGDAPSEIEVGIAELDASSDLVLYPNPSSDVIYWEFDNSTPENLVVEVFDAQGKMIRFWRENASLATHTLNVSELEAGIYHLRVESTKGVAQRAFVVK